MHMPSHTIALTLTPPAGLKRKQFATALATRLDLDVTYLGAPTFAYQTGEVTISRDWTIQLASDAAELIPAIEAAAADCEVKLTQPRSSTQPSPQPTRADDAEPADTVPTVATTGWSDRTRANLEALLASKGALIAKALGIPSTPVEFRDDDTVAFPWTATLSDETTREAVIPLVEGLCRRAQQAARIHPTPPREGNDKYTMRCFLLALGFIGAEYKHTRRILLAHLDGNAAWRSPATSKDA
ncbi:hypothetical protein NQ024_08010 [Corynebacterium sp. 35RC1]|nr:hypothetical protein [Corynebacterium sp. 35RC1]